jgi:hypothetical protein
MVMGVDADRYDAGRGRSGSDQRGGGGADGGRRRTSSGCIVARFGRGRYVTGTNSPQRALLRPSSGAEAGGGEQGLDPPQWFAPPNDFQ